MNAWDTGYLRSICTGPNEKEKTGKGERIKIAFVPSCGIGYKVIGQRWVVEQNRLTDVDTMFRCNEGAKLFKEGKVDILFCTGGIFLPPHLQTLPASHLMKAYLIGMHGIPEDRIWIEERSVDSWENVYEMKRQLISHYIDIAEIKIIIVSHFTHAARLKILLLYNGFKRVKYGGKSHPVGWKWYPRELRNLILTLLDPEGKSYFVLRERENRRQWQK